MKNIIKRIFSIITIVFLLFTCFISESVFATQDIDDFNPDYLKIKVGYEGGPYLDKHTFSKYDLQTYSGSDIVGYTHMRDNGVIAYDFAKGPMLEFLLRQAGIDERSIKRFAFITADLYIAENTDMSRDAILRDARYHYPNLIKYPDNEEQGKTGGHPVKARIATHSLPQQLVMNPTSLSDDLQKLYDEAATGNTMISNDNGFRLMLGAYPDLRVNTSRFSATNVYQITVVLAGKPAVDIKPKKVIREEKVGNETVQVVIELGPDDDYDLQVGDVIEYEAENKTEGLSENNPNYNSEDDIEQGTYFSNRAFSDSLVETYGKDNVPQPKIIGINENVGKIREDGKIEIIGQGDLNLEAGLIDISGKNINTDVYGNPSPIKGYLTVKGNTIAEVKNPGPITPEEPVDEPKEEPDEEPVDEPEEEPVDEPTTPEVPVAPETPNIPGTPDKPEKPGEENNPQTPDKDKPKEGNENEEVIDGSDNKSGDSNTDGNKDGKPGGTSNDSKNTGTGGGTGKGTGSGSGDGIGTGEGSGSGAGTGSGAGIGTTSGNGSGTGGRWLKIASVGNATGEFRNNTGISRTAGSGGSTGAGGTMQRRSTSSSSGTRTVENADLNIDTSARNLASAKNQASRNKTVNEPDKKSSGAIQERKQYLGETGDKAVSRNIYEMDEDSVALGELKLENPLEPWAIGIGIISFIYGIFYAKWRFMKSL